MPTDTPEARKRLTRRAQLIRLLADLMTYMSHDPDCETQESTPRACTCGLAEIEQLTVTALDEAGERHKSRTVKGEPLE